jgi:hypothetical protein
MKRTVLNVFILVLALGFYNFESANASLNIDAMAIISFESQTIDYGTILQDSDGNRVFNFQNTGDAPLLITNVKTSCGCTVPSYSKDPILPGETGEIKINYNTKKLGAFTKSITVSSNTKSGNTVLKIKGNIIASE